jgi:hypothetical protein
MLGLRKFKIVLPFALTFNPLIAELSPICHLRALLGAHHILHVSRIRVKGTNVELYRNNDYKYMFNYI